MDYKSIHVHKTKKSSLETVLILSIPILAFFTLLAIFSSKILK